MYKTGHTELVEVRFYTSSSLRQAQSKLAQTDIKIY
jgi:hypothetical protein